MHYTAYPDRLEIISYTIDTYSCDLKEHIREGLTAPQKYISSKYFYDAYGSTLFEKICKLPEYYLTRTELSILKESAPEIMEEFQKGDIIELGSGANWKIKILLNATDEANLSDIRYMPVDVSESALIDASEELLEVYPDLKVTGIVADFTKHLEKLPTLDNRFFTFLGSTIGNLTEKEGIHFMKNISSLMEKNDRFLLGFDMLKAKEMIERAYNDTQGVTSEFNKNSLNVVNRELNADFNPDHFDHIAFLNAEKEQIEMHLKANRDVSVEIRDLDLTIEMEKGETIHTEVSRKFTQKSIETLAEGASLKINRWFTDPRKWFSLVEFIPK
ncbi:MAG: L-histidine N(alpha)-methyltransferase [Candidatus Kuenenia sp.]|nr:L-histidine N(alpha)-methyltransferase [Candidatus Kuenenia hertensis]